MMGTQSGWRIVRLFSAFTDAVMEQAIQSDAPLGRSRSMISYCISPYAAMCMSTAMILNRIIVFATSRQNRKLPLASRLVLRLFALYILFQGSYGVFTCIKTYSQSETLRGLIPDYYTFDLAKFAKQTFLGMSYGKEAFKELGPTPSVLKPFYLSLCLSQIIETFIAVASGQEPSVESGITLFEYSLAFQEVQLAKKPSIELLALCFSSLLNHGLIHVLSLLKLEKYRLIPSTIVGLWVLNYVAKSIYTLRVFYMPAVLVFGYLPQLITLSIIVLCSLIFVFASIFKGSFTDSSFSTINNLATLNISLSDDFQSTLMTLGGFAINATGRVTYNREVSGVKVPRATWLEMTTSDTPSKKPGYSNDLQYHPDMANLIESTSASKIKSWQVLQRLTTAKTLVTDMVDLLVSLPLRRKPKFLQKLEVDKLPPVKPPSNGLRNLYRDLANARLDNIEDSYAELLLGEDLIDFDDSVDYDGNAEEELQEGNEDYESDTEALALQTVPETEEPVILPAEELAMLLSPSNPQEARMARILGAHLRSSEKALTRSSFNALFSSPAWKLEDVIHENRRPHRGDDDEDEMGIGTCVVCHTNPRQIILWPCKCLAVCDLCRVSLSMRAFDECVCCRRKVEGFSKIYVP